MRPPAASRRRLACAALLCAALLLLPSAAEGGGSKDKKSSKKGSKKGKKKGGTLEVTIPEGARPGDRLDFVTPDNQGFYVNVPKGGSPGQKFSLQLPDGVRKARMRKFQPPKRKKKKKPDGEGGKDGSSSGGKKKRKGPVPPLVAIDFGSETIKIAVETDFPDPMVLNLQGGRTTPNVLALQDDEIFFGDLAVSLQQRINASYAHTKQLLGRRADEAAPRDSEPSGGPPWFHATGLRYDFVPDAERGTVRLPDGKQDEDGVITTLSAEELAALTLMKCKGLATAHLHQQRMDGAAEAPPPHFAIAVPVWFTKLQRSALSDAARLAGIDQVALINENVALAYKYEMARSPREVLESKLHKKRKDDVHTALLIDVGASGATASIATFRIGTKTKGRKMSVIETIDIRAVAWSDSMGGRAFDRRLAALLAERYNAAQRELGSTADVRDDRRALVTLLREAARTKEKLSANKELAVTIEGLPSAVAEFGDLKTVVTRAELEEVTADLVEALLVPVRRVLDETGISKSQLDAVTVVGGGSRVPIIQEKLKKLLRREQLDLKLSGDEAVAQGLAAYGAAQLQGKDFRRDLKVVHQPYPLGLTPSRAQLVAPLEGAAWDEAVASIGRLTEKAAALEAHQQVIPTPLHVLDRISPIFYPFFPVFCAFSPSRRGGSNEPKTGIQGHETVSRAPKHRFSGLANSGCSERMAGALGLRVTAVPMGGAAVARWKRGPRGGAAGRGGAGGWGRGRRGCGGWGRGGGVVVVRLRGRRGGCRRERRRRRRQRERRRRER
eukprot:COSAG04_NODE_1577_length_6261_cov_20.494645_2_plen_784_part_00